VEKYGGDTKTYDQKSNTTKTYTNKSRGHDPTKGYGAEKSPKMDRSDIHGLGIGDDIVLNGNPYTIVDILSGDNISGEAVIYKIIDPAKKNFSLKLYYKFSNPKDEPNPESLQRIKTITDPNILKLYDYGTHEKKYLQKHCFEICEFAKGSDLLSVPDILKKYTVEFIETHVIPQILKGISTLQDHKIFHCDIKPQNIFFLDEEQTNLVIGDYGSAKTFDEASEKQSRRTSTSKGTDYYLAPEQARGMISEKNDYYSFGMVLLHLLYPESFNRNNFNKIIERQFARKPIINFQPESQRINDLIAGLTLVDVTARWSKNEVSAWLRHEKVKVDYNGGMGEKIQPIKLGNSTIYTAEDLIQYIENDSHWSEKLIEDIEGYNQLKRWIGDLQDIDKKKNFDTMVRTYQQDGKAFVKQSIIRYFDPNRPIHLDMKTYDFWNAVINTFKTHPTLQYGIP
jgi:serine/threonine protein kinase